MGSVRALGNPTFFSINLTQSGKVYLGGLVVSVFMSFGLSSSGGFNVGHDLGIMAPFFVTCLSLSKRRLFDVCNDLISS